MLPRVRTLCAAALFAAVVIAYAVFAGLSTERRMLDAAEAEGRALLHALAAGIESTLDAGRALEIGLAERLFETATGVERSLAEAPGREEEVLARAVRRTGLRGAVLLDRKLAVRAAARAADEADVGQGSDGPFAGARLGRLEADTIARRVAAAGLGQKDRLVLGFGENPFGPRGEFLVAAATEDGGYLVLQQDAARIAEFHAASGVQRLLTAAGRTSGIGYLVLQSADGAILAADTPEHRALDLPPPSDTPGWRTGPDGSRLMDVALPAPWEGEPRGHLRVGLDAGPVEALEARARRDLFVFTALALVLGVGGLLVLDKLARRAADREAALRTELVERERFASLGRLAGGVAHEIRGPLNTLSMAAQRLRRETRPADPERARRFDGLTGALGAAVTRLDRTVEEFLALGERRPPAETAALDVAELLREACAQEDVRTAVSVEPGLTVRGDRHLLVRAVANLVRNAGQAAPGLPAAVSARGDGGRVVISVTDAGPGIPVEQRRRVFEPFFTGRPNGTGLGLTLARDAVERHGGTLSAESGEGGTGAKFVIRLPQEAPGA